ncbi:unnamed protein product [Dracunculus medinensis]|uniref:Acetyltransferase n=1 Tax=Dracunculus medinensis TaxID=318479 RepID=A0A0N4U8X3_DRAME|nr:unnamed protein product [Dracunculus medinensis]
MAKSAQITLSDRIFNTNGNRAEVDTLSEIYPMSFLEAAWQTHGMRGWSKADMFNYFPLYFPGSSHSHWLAI